MTECPIGQEPLTLRQMIEVESWLSQMEALIECLRDSDQEPINGFLSVNLERYAQNLPMLQRRLLQDLLILSQQTKSSLSNPQQKDENDTSTTSASKPKPFPCLDAICPQCSSDSSFSPGTRNPDIEKEAKKLL